MSKYSCITWFLNVWSKLANLACLQDLRIDCKELWTQILKICVQSSNRSVFVLLKVQDHQITILLGEISVFHSHGFFFCADRTSRGTQLGSVTVRDYVALDAASTVLLEMYRRGSVLQVPTRAAQIYSARCGGDEWEYIYNIVYQYIYIRIYI
jgi:hypothetical protein